MGHWQGRHGPAGAQGPGWREALEKPEASAPLPACDPAQAWPPKRCSPSVQPPPTPGRGRLGALDRGRSWTPRVPASRGQRGRGRPRRAAQPLTLPLAVPPLTPIRKGRWCGRSASGAAPSQSPPPAEAISGPACPHRVRRCRRLPKPVRAAAPARRSETAPRGSTSGGRTSRRGAGRWARAGHGGSCGPRRALRMRRPGPAAARRRFLGAPGSSCRMLAAQDKSHSVSQLAAGDFRRRAASQAEARGRPRRFPASRPPPHPGAWGLRGWRAGVAT